MDIADFQLLARYNIWSTQKLNQSLIQVSDEDFFKDSGLFFQSIFGTLNHLLLGEHYLWHVRFKDGASPSMPLNSIIEHDRPVLLRELEQRAAHWLSFLDQLDPARLNGMLHYQSAAGQAISLPFSSAFIHVFNHGTHHRGQITAALTAMGYACPELDLVYMLLEEQNASPHP